MKHIFIVVILLNAGNAISCTVYNDSLKRYYVQVHAAEHELMNEDYRKAIKSYDSAFLYLKYPFSVDIYNKLVCSILVHNYDVALSESTKLIRQGAPVEFFNTTFYNGFRTSKEFKKLMNVYPELHNDYLRRIDQELVKKVKILNDADQAVHCMLPALYADTAFVNKMRSNDDSLSTLLSELLIKNNFLSENIIGFNFTNDSSFSSWPLYGIVAFHQIQKGGVILNNILYEAMRSGKLRSDIALHWVNPEERLLT